jgi:drug/metabolite transporter (DMT)-like permease
LWATLAGFGFGIFQAFNRRAGRSFDPYIATFILLAGSTIVLAVASVLSEDLSQLNGVPIMAHVNFGLAGFFHFYLGWTLLSISQNRVGAARTGALLGTTPFFALFISALAFDEFLRLPVLSGIIILVAGVYLISFEKNPFAGTGTTILRDSLFGLGVAVCFAISPIFIRAGMKDLNSPLLGVTIGMGISAIAYGITLLFQRKQIQQGPITRDALWFQLGAAFFVGVSTWARWIALDMTSVSVVLALGRLNVPVVILLSPLLVGKAAENVTSRVWLGAAMIVGGSLILNFYG